MYEIEFADKKEISKLYYPKPAKFFIPEWYKKTKPEQENADWTTGVNQFTIKKCMPVLDAMTTGYIIPTYQDVLFFRNENGEHGMTWASNNPVIEQHHKRQTPLMPTNNQKAILKWINPWAIRTPKGTSCLFISPVYAENEFFTCLAGVVDTDVYNVPVNFPFLLKDSNFTGILPAGTPMIQVIPFQRKEWKMNVVSQNKIDVEEQRRTLWSVHTNRYKKLFRQNKIYL